MFCILQTSYTTKTKTHDELQLEYEYKTVAFNGRVDLLTSIL